MPKVLGSGRKSSNKWAEVTKTEEECKYSRNVISCKGGRIRTHLDKCYDQKNQQKFVVSENKSTNNFETKSASRFKNASCSQSEIPKLKKTTEKLCCNN